MPRCISMLWIVMMRAIPCVLCHLYLVYVHTVYTYIAEYTNICPRKCTYVPVCFFFNPPMSTAHLLQQSCGGANWPKWSTIDNPTNAGYSMLFVDMCCTTEDANKPVLLAMSCSKQSILGGEESPVKTETVLSSQTVLRTRLGLIRCCLVTRNRSLLPGPVDVGSAAQTCPTHSSFGATMCHSSITTPIFIFGFGNKSNDRNISTPWALHLPVHWLLFNRFRGLLG